MFPWLLDAPTGVRPDFCDGASASRQGLWAELLGGEPPRVGRQAAPVYQRDASGLFKKIQKTPSELGGDAETSASELHPSAFSARRGARFWTATFIGARSP